MFDRQQLLTWIAQEEATINAFFQDFISAENPHPPGTQGHAVT